MDTPVFDFVTQYIKRHPVRLHMPGHKGKEFLGCESRDITEIFGADTLYEAKGIILESEKNAAELFGSRDTFFSTEGSSLTIRAMLYIAKELAIRAGNCSNIIVAARNVHKAFVYAVGLLDLNVVWLYPEGKGISSFCSCAITPEKLKETLEKLNEKPIAVYITSPNYLGEIQDIENLSQAAHEAGTYLLVDNAHGAYLHFLKEPQHPLDLGADLCADSAHKTLPVLTGGGYLHIGGKVPEITRFLAKNAMALFGSTSPSYLVLQSLDLCNRYLADEYRKKLAEIIRKIVVLKEELKKNGWLLLDSEPLKITILMPNSYSGEYLAQCLRNKGIECEYADDSYLVLMLTPENRDKDLILVNNVLGKNENVYLEKPPHFFLKPRVACTIREALLLPPILIKTEDAMNRICALPIVNCPPAIPIVMAGEIIDKEEIKTLLHYGIKEIAVIDVMK